MILDNLAKLINELENILKKDNKWKSNNDYLFRSKMKKIYQNTCKKNNNPVFVPYVINNLKKLSQKEKKCPKVTCPSQTQQTQQTQQPQQPNQDLNNLKQVIEALIDEIDNGFDLPELNIQPINVNATYNGDPNPQADPVVNALNN